MGEGVERSETDEVVKNNEILRYNPSVCHPERSVAESNAERDTQCRDLGRIFILPSRENTNVEQLNLK